MNFSLRKTLHVNPGETNESQREISLGLKNAPNLFTVLMSGTKHKQKE